MYMQQMTPEHIKKIGTYFQRNYIEGERIPTIPVKDWKSWKEEEFRQIRYYDSQNNRRGIYTNKDKAPPRIHLRGDGNFSDLSDGHLEFKCWVQTKVEEVVLGKSSPKFLAQEQASSERDKAMDTWETLSDHFQNMLFDLFFSKQHLENTKFREPKHLLLLWKILATVNPDLNSVKYGIIESTTLTPSVLDKDSFNPILRISRELPRILIANSKSTDASPKQIYQMMEGVKGGKKLRKFAKKQTELNFIDDEKLWKITSKLVKAKIEPPPDWKWINISIPGMTLMAVLSNQIENILLDARKKAIRYVEEDSYPLQDEFGLLEFTFDEKTAYSQLKNRGFGSTNLDKSETPENVTKHNAIQLTYNLVNMLLEPKNAILSREYMTNEEYIEHFLDGDESLLKNTKSKHQPHNLYFTPKMKELIKDSGYINFSEGTEHPIYRWLRGSQHRWMYCPPVPHTSNTTNNERGGFLFEHNRKIIGGSHDRYEEFDTPRCEISDGLIKALNTLQDTQWEINLHFLKAFFDIELDDGTMLGTIGWKNKNLRIKSLKPKSELSKVFTPNDQNGKESRVNVLEWARRIIEHNANVFWHSWICDFRGRMSPRCTKLSPQGDDLDRSLIRFKEWKSLGDEGIFWFRVHLHNMMEGIKWDEWIGKDSKPAEKHRTFPERSKWVEDNIDQLRILANNPIKYREILELDKYRSGKSEAFQRLAILIEIDRIYDEYDNNGNNWEEVKSGQVVYLDASCNGYQHLAAIFRDKELAEKVNISMNGVRPQDLYDIVSKNVDETKARAFLKKHLPDGIDIESILKKTFSRSSAKMPTMTRAYGSKDIAKCLSGKNGRGKSKFHEVDFFVSEFSAKDKEEYKKIPDNVKIAYNNYIEEHISKSGFTDLIRKKPKKGKGKGKKNESKAKRWEKLLSNKRYIPLWNEGSALHKALLENPDEVSKFFNENPELQPQFTEIIKSAFEYSISITASKYDELEKQLDKISNNSNGLHPGITWNLPDKFRVNHYYIKTYQRDKSSKGMPCHIGSAYNSFVPKWYKGKKSNKTISNRIKELYLPKNEKKWNENILKNNDLKEEIKKNCTKVLGHKFMVKVMRCIDPKNSSDDANEIKRLLTHANYTLQLHDSKEEDRINRVKLKSGLAPNFIHSLDAYHMRSTINQMASGSPNFSFWAVHDAFGVHARDIPDLRDIVRNGLHELHKERDFNHWLDEMSDSGTITSNKIGDDSWLSKILEAEYLIS